MVGANQFGPYGTGKSRQAKGPKKSGIGQTSASPFLKAASRKPKSPMSAYELQFKAFAKKHGKSIRPK